MGPKASELSTNVCSVQIRFLFLICQARNAIMSNQRHAPLVQEASQAADLKLMFALFCTWNIMVMIMWHNIHFVEMGNPSSSCPKGRQFAKCFFIGGMLFNLRVEKVVTCRDRGQASKDFHVQRQSLSTLCYGLCAQQDVKLHRNCGNSCET